MLPVPLPQEIQIGYAAAAVLLGLYLVSLYRVKIMKKTKAKSGMGEKLIEE